MAFNGLTDLRSRYRRFLSATDHLRLNRYDQDNRRQENSDKKCDAYRHLAAEDEARAVL